MSDQFEAFRYLSIDLETFLYVPGVVNHSPGRYVLSIDACMFDFLELKSINVDVFIYSLSLSALLNLDLSVPLASSPLITSSFHTADRFFLVMTLCPQDATEKSKNFIHQMVFITNKEFISAHLSYHLYLPIVS